MQKEQQPQRTVCAYINKCAGYTVCRHQLKLNKLRPNRAAFRLHVDTANMA
jgi:hypothetical protein